MKTIKVLRLVCVPLLAGGLVFAQQQPAPPAQGPQQQFPPEQLDTLVAPVALYPDALLSQVLVASTYPLEITEAAQWLDQNGNLQGPQLVDAARQQNWDPSVQALVVFPDVIGRLASDIRWTTDLGNAFLAQQADVMRAVQNMRAQAWQAGKLRSNEQETVNREMQGDQQAIEIQPANPQVVYVPDYDPAYIWGPPAYGYYPAWDYAGFGFGFGPGIYIGSFFGGLGWGGWGWGPNWFGYSIYQRPFFFNHYGFGGRGFRGGNWAHDPGHRHGVPYSNGALNGRYGGGNRGGQSYAGRQGGGWNHFGQAGSPRGSSGNRAASGYRSSPSNGGSYGGNRAAPGYRSSPSNGGSYGGNRAAPGYRSSPSNGGGYGGNRAAPGYRSSPSNGGGYGGNRAAPSYRSSPSNGGGYGGNRAAPSYRSSPSYGGGYGGGRGAAPSYHSAPSYHGGGGGGGAHSSGGGSGHSGGGGGSQGGGGGSHGGHSR
jgi:hypothetical protein